MGHSVKQQLALLDAVEDQIKESEVKIKMVIRDTPTMKLLMTIPGVGMIPAIVIASEVGDVQRFSVPDKLASYAGTAPQVKASGDKIFYGAVRSDVNCYLEWAFIEAANTIVIFHKQWTGRHFASLYARFREKEGILRRSSPWPDISRKRHIEFLKRENHIEKGTIISPFRPPGSRRDCSHEASNLENRMRSSAGEMLMPPRRRLHASDEMGREQCNETNFLAKEGELGNKSLDLPGAFIHANITVH